MEESRAVIGYDDSVIRETHNGENHQDHDGPESTQSRTELEHVPRHCCTRPMHITFSSSSLVLFGCKKQKSKKIMIGEFGD